MKRILTFLFLVILLSINAQEAYKKNEVRLGVLKALVVPSLDLQYERVTNESFGYGASLIVGLDNESYYQFAFSPYARMYFNESIDYGSKGFFVETFLLASSTNPFDDTYYNELSGYNESLDASYFDTALGVGAGNKWVNKNGFVFEFMLGMGRNLGFSDKTDDFIFKGHFSLGFRF